jgi:hypothetical protein
LSNQEKFYCELSLYFASLTRTVLVVKFPVPVNGCSWKLWPEFKVYRMGLYSN